VKKWIYLFSVGIFALSLFGCGDKNQSSNQKEYDIYYVNYDETKIEKIVSHIPSNSSLEDSEAVSQGDSKQTISENISETKNPAVSADSDSSETNETESESEQVKTQIYELLTLLATAPDSANYKAPITTKMGKVKYTYLDGQVTLYFTDAYKDLSNTTEVLTRAAIVKTLTQLDSVKYITFLVQEEPLTDYDANIIGFMTADTFMDNEGSQINAYEKAQLTLFFANSDGTKLVEVNRTVIYNSNISLEKLVLEQLIQGSTNSNIFSAINPETKIINVTVKDSICYVNLSEEFLKAVEGVSAKVTLFSIVDSLVELPGINKVQILITGKTDITFREIVNLTTFFERDLTLVQ
jgi:germination protein M